MEKGNKLSYEELQKKYEEVKEENERLNDEMDRRHRYGLVLEEMIVDLSEENKRLKNAMSKFIGWREGFLEKLEKGGSMDFLHRRK